MIGSHVFQRFYACAKPKFESKNRHSQQNPYVWTTSVADKGCGKFRKMCWSLWVANSVNPVLMPMRHLKNMHTLFVEPLSLQHASIVFKLGNDSQPSWLGVGHYELFEVKKVVVGVLGGSKGTKAWGNPPAHHSHRKLTNRALCLQFQKSNVKCHFSLFIEPLGKRSKTTEKNIFFLRMFHDLLEKNIPREVGALSSENVVVFTDACYERDHPTWPCGLGGVVFACGRVFFFSLAADEKLRTLLGEKTLLFQVSWMRRAKRPSNINQEHLTNKRNTVNKKQASSSLKS